MPHDAAIVSVTARQVYSDRGHPGVEATVTTAGGAAGTAICTAGISVGQHEVEFAYDGGPRFRGKGVQRAVDNVNNLIAPALAGMNAADQLAVDDAMLNLGGPGAKARLGGNATAAVSAAALKAGAAALGIPLYQHVGGATAFTLPVPGVGCLVGSDRYGGGARSGGKPSYELHCFGFATFAEASYAGWELSTEWTQVLKQAYGMTYNSVAVPKGVVKHDREIWDLMVKTIDRLGYTGKVGIQVDVAAGTYWEKDKSRFVGIFDADDKTRDDLLRLYETMVRDYPFVILEDPLDEDDYEGHAILTRMLDIQIVGDDLFTTNPERVRQGIAAGAANTVLLNVNQIGTISEAFEMVQLAYRYGYGVMPCSSRGEGADIADYTVGLNCGTVRGGATGPSGNRYLQIEAELGRRAVFPGRAGLRGRRR
ncbi:MAG: enolase C-terminal domain-like protein [Chloroflexota bacterium]